jgi:hypothetical protein
MGILGDILGGWQTIQPDHIKHATEENFAKIKKAVLSNAEIARSASRRATTRETKWVSKDSLNQMRLLKNLEYKIQKKRRNV